MEHEKLETADIAVELQKLAESGVFTQRTADACAQAAWIVKKLREVILTDWSDSSVDTAKIEKLKWILVKHHEG
jgi:hypothetical protein